MNGNFGTIEHNGKTITLMELDLNGMKYKKINGLWHFYYPLKNGVDWHYVVNYAIRKELKAAEEG